jgi:molecular chaperone GrpE
LDQQEKAEGAPAPEKGSKGIEQEPPAATPKPSPEEQALQERYLRLAAEFDNFRKRSDRDMSEFRKRASDHLLLQLLDVVDNLDRALEAPAPAEAAKLREGVAAIRAQLWHVLDREGVRPIEALGRRFDPFEMEAALRMPSADVPEGMVVREVQRGYKGRYHVLRHAKVIVSSGPAEEQPRCEPAAQAPKDAAEGVAQDPKEHEARGPSHGAEHHHQHQPDGHKHHKESNRE